MKSWLHEISESYIGSRVASRKDLKEHYSSLTKEQRFGLLSKNVLAYLDEQLQNAYRFGINDLNEEELNSILSFILEIKDNTEIQKNKPKEPKNMLDTAFPGLASSAKGIMNLSIKKPKPKSLKENKENHDKIVKDIANHMGMNFPHIADNERGGLPKHAYDKKASVEDNIETLNKHAPPGGYTNHEEALNSIRHIIADNPSVRTHIEDKAIQYGGADPDTVMDDDLNDHVDSVIDNIHGAVTR